MAAEAIPISDLSKTKNIFSLKLLGQLEPSFAGMMYERSSTKIPLLF